ncbi:sigma-54-dependent transcriptional regulator [Luteimonas wenzhouensis]|jgi:DNA-binding NtrC family response regulator|uniref:Sigma-54-dependent Fis family transcriptional regulator n=1 Tax=Luteimonas wenzhouensis TaxID=2599615 RepID=A0A5C5TZI5_9GAMM|nr:sigma-54-dependent Fis family transcriptional regulator [Xanthomonadaceae bacterium]TWT19571.1 sigma-54-dependent Fis family transcriptional regulator [Luteimonas wenzhouensis]
MPTVLVIDDNPSVGTALELLFSLHDIDVVHADGPEPGLEVLGRGGIDLVIQDMNFHADTTSGDEGVALFREIRARHPDMPVILLTAWTRLESAVDLIKAGAADYLGKPWDDHKLLASVNNLLELAETRRELAARSAGERGRREAMARDHDLRGLVYDDVASETVVSLALQVARSELPVLVTGPNGAGKEKYAEIIHYNSAVKSGPFVAVNCGALPSELIEAELFGAEPGAYTGAGNKARIGKFEAADGGTLFLDEIGTLPPAGQVKLLRVLESGRFQRLGATQERSVRVRVVSATNADLAAMIADGRFREDLYYRLNGIELRLPPLARRPRDILPLARHFLPAGKAFSRQAERALLEHSWPGNVRELRNAVQRAALLSGDTIEAAALGLAAPPQDPAIVAHGEEPGRAAIEEALQRAGGVIAQAASDLGMSRQALYRRMDRYGIPRG